MYDILRDCAGYLWLALGIFWLAGALTAKRTERTQSPGSRLLQITPEIAAFSLLFGRLPWPSWLRWRFVHGDTLTAAWVGLALTAAGIAFAIWARLWIGRNWSGRVTIKEQHELIQNGPYAIVRHPIYSGFLLGILGTAIASGELHALLALPLAALGWTFKLRMEESFMIQQFGSTYLDYKRRVKALVPFLV
ncbi:MAG TPA: isoprenylcysteine carboxylmethyltransferase family protein [Candidatus Angelobacter sp.]